MNFADPLAVETEVAACCQQVEHHFDLETQVRMVLSAWQSDLPRLLIFDNCEDQDLLEQWLPKSGAPRVLITSRCQEWAPYLDVQTLRIWVLARSESIDLLQGLASQLSALDADAIANELGDLPLALHLAGSYLGRYKTSPHVYLEQLQDKSFLYHESMSGRGSVSSPTQHELHVAKTFTLSYEKLNSGDRIDRIALSLLALASCLAPGTPIPKALLLQTLRAKEESVDENDIEDGLSRLLEVGLITAETQEMLVLHRLLVFYAQDALCPDNQIHKSVETTLLAEARRINNSGFPAGLLTWQAHLQFVTDQARSRGDVTYVDLCSALGRHLESVGEYRKAIDYYELALSCIEKKLGTDHPHTKTVSQNLLSARTSEKNQHIR